MRLGNTSFSLFLCLLLSASLPSFSQGKQFKALLVTTTRGFHHESLHAGVLAMQQLGQKHFFDVEVMSGGGNINDNYLKQFQVIIFLNTTGDIFDSAQQKVMERFIQSGKGFVGIHSASDTEYDWEWYTQLVGRMFYVHPAIQTAKLHVVDPGFPGLQGFTGGIWWTDEWYQFGPEKVKGLNYILRVDEGTYKAKAGGGNRATDGMGEFHPIAWYHEFDGGRSFYTALGHLSAIYQNPVFLDHVYAGILWAATGKK
ncbi:MAG TPA: ThuA domain-containing protein [Phnomibacter sp.]|nr:ThuA domain-containing protein [Phnomibacter sp.]